MLKTHHIFRRLRTTQEDNGDNVKDHYDNCYGDDDDEYEEHLGSIDSLGKGGGGLIARELSYSVWFIPRWNSRGYTVMHHHHKTYHLGLKVFLKIRTWNGLQSVGFNSVRLWDRLPVQILHWQKCDHLECAACLSLSCTVKWWRVPQSPEVVGLFVCLFVGGCGVEWEEEEEGGVAILQCNSRPRPGCVSPPQVHILFSSLMSYRPLPLLPALTNHLL